MLFNEAALNEKVRHLDAILRDRPVLDRVVARLAAGRPVEIERVPRPWEPGGGSSLFRVRIGDDAYLLKVKRLSVTVESRLEAESAFSSVPALRNEFAFLQRVRDLGPNAPQRFHYAEDEGYGFLFVEILLPFAAAATDLDAADLVEAYAQIETFLRALHARGIAHTDVHEMNIMFRGQTPVLVDFEEARDIRQDVPFESSLDCVGENAYGDVGMMPRRGDTIGGLTCLRRLREVFKRIVGAKLESLISQCSFDSSCPYLASLDHGRDDRIYQSIQLDGLAVAGQRPVQDERIPQILEVIERHFDHPITHLDVGSNVGRFSLELMRSPRVAHSYGIEAFAPYVRLAKTLAFLTASKAEFLCLECGRGRLVEALGGRHVDCVTIYSAYHHIRNRAVFLDELRRLDPELVLLEMATQPECYEGRSWEQELDAIAHALGRPGWRLLGFSSDYRRPIVTIGKSARPPRRHASSSACPRVSVVMPTYNQARYLPQAVESVLGQTLGDFEFLIVDDGSTDGTPSLLSRLSDARVRVIRQDNQGLPRALNAGFRQARGKYLTWVSSDNLSAPTFLEELAGALDSFPDALFAYSAFRWIDEEGKPTKVTAWQDATYPAMLCGNPGIASFMYRRECHQQVGWYAEDLVGAEDWDMWLRIRERAEPVYVTTPLCYYRSHEGSLTATRAAAIQAACMGTFRNALTRLWSTPGSPLDRLYPLIAACRDQRAARFDAGLDIGLRILASPFGTPSVARDFLAAALALRPEAPDGLVGLGAAELACGNTARALELLGAVTDADPFAARVAADLSGLAAAGKTLRPSSAVLPLRLRPRSELFRLEGRRRRQRSFCPTGAAVSEPEAVRSQDGLTAAEVSHLIDVAGSTRTVCIWGAGTAGLRACGLLRRLGIEAALFIDNDARKHGTRHAGLEVIPPSRLSETGLSAAATVIVVASAAGDEIRTVLERVGRREGIDFVVLSPATLASLPTLDAGAL